MADWESKASLAARAGDHDLAARAKQRVAEWRTIDGETAAVLGEYETGQRRLEDALAQLVALARRSDPTSRQPPA